ARKTAEAICKQVYRAYAEAHPESKEFKHPPDKQMLNDLIARLERVSRFPLVVSTAIRTIQAFGNIGSHDQGAEADHVTTEAIQPAIAALETVVRWFCTEQGLELDLVTGASEGSAAGPTTGSLPAVPAAAAAPVAKEGSGTRIRNLAIAGAAVLSALAALAGLFADSLSTIDQMGGNEVSAEMATAQARLNSVFDKLSAPLPPTDCLGDDHRVLDSAAKAGELLQGQVKGTVRPQDKEAVGQLEKLADEHPNSAVSWALLAQGQLAVAADTSTIGNSAKVAAKLCGDWALPSNIEGNALFRSGELDGAEVAYRSALGLYPAYGAPRFNLAMLSMKKKDFAKAEEELGRLLEHHPHHDDARLVRAQTRVMNGNLDGALEDARASVEQDPRDPSGYALLGQVLQRRGEAEEARTALCRAKALGHPAGDKLCPEASP
ncbi:MAG: tetratricopeptide repeat protein, partial [Myxococcota bacterium]|nr:tetratricopeptide repeat protein [Myxococcota bacterium]